MTLLESISPTAKLLLDPDVHFFTCTYTWNHSVLGELSNSTVIHGVDADAALKSFRSKNPHLTSARIVTK